MKLIFFIRSVVMTLFFFISTIFFSASGILNFLSFNNKKLHDKIISTWGRIACRLFNVKVNLHHPENIPRQGCVFLFNHSSFFDIFALAGAIPDVRFGAKIELFSIPLFGSAMKSAGTLPIARGSREEVFKVYSAARGRIQNNEKFALSPEGGRFYGENLSPFKAGPFIFAITSGAVIAPVIIKGAYEVLPKKNFIANTDRWRRKIDIYFLKPHSVEGYTNENRQELQKIVYDQMNTKWTAHD
ncbi:MAG: 1-acyl-sn-glycerol-3-phosphate acyltransferase [Bdellovibrionaceae bacterium]|nr:1-acyl-sn-glycerol-3-phosphate acyltransferase [Pseudobdellovibrionaceae bacterium]